MKNKGLFQPLTLGAILALGFLSVWIAIGFVAFENSRMIAMRNLVVETISIRADGTALIQHYENDALSQRDLNGNPVILPEDDPIGDMHGTSLIPASPWRKEDSEWEQRVRFFTDGREPSTAWYFITDGTPEGKGYFVGYDDHSKAKIGYLGTAGFRAEVLPPEERFSFAGSTYGVRSRLFSFGQSSYRVVPSIGSLGIEQSHGAMPSIVYVLGLDQKLYEANLRKRTVRVIVHAQGLHSLGGIDDLTDKTVGNWRLAVRTDAAILVLDKHGIEQQRYPIPQELRERAFTFGETSSGEAVMYYSDERDIMDTEAVHHLIWVRPDGRSRTTVVTLPGDSGMRSLRYSFAALVPSPVALGILGIAQSRDLLKDGTVSTFSSALVRTLIEYWPALAIAQVLAAILAVLCYRRQARYGFSLTERIVWPLFVLLLGLPGWIGYRFGRSWPVLEVCPECGATVPRDRESCRCCTHDFPRPALKGTEVFA